ncbi:MAG TPA: hypothetical protein VFZ76_09525 [Anaerolineales bacterium]
MSMSLDGYVADLNDGVAEVFDWYFYSSLTGYNFLSLLRVNGRIVHACTHGIWDRETPIDICPGAACPTDDLPANLLAVLDGSSAGIACPFHLQYPQFHV